MQCEQLYGVSIIIPTYCEAQNISALIRRIANVSFNQHPFEVIIIDDDSHDGIEEIVKELAMEHTWLRIIVRTHEKSLSKSVICGFQHAIYPLLVVMDADLSHPPEKIPEMIKVLSAPDTDMVIASRYAPGGTTDPTWPVRRKIVSYCAALLVRILLLTKVQDPLSGFIGIKKQSVTSCHALAPIGWKIGLELMIKCHCKTIHEIPIHFSQRYRGASKLCLKNIIEYLQHVFKLFYYKYFSNH